MSEFEVFTNYLKSLHYENSIERTYDIKALAIKYEHEITEWLFFNIEKIKKKNLACSKTKTDLKKLSEKTHFDFEKNMNELIKWVSRFLSLNCNYEQRIIITNILHELYKLETKESILIFIELLQNYLNQNILKSNTCFLEEIFQKILYLDSDCADIRIKKYEIISVLIVHLFSLDSNGKTMANDEMIPASVHLPLIAKLWDEISILPEEKEICSILNLFIVIIKNTGKFYQRRLFSSELLAFLFEFMNFDNCSTFARPEAACFFEFVEILISNFEIASDLRIKIWQVVAQYFEILDLTNLTKSFVIYDFKCCINTIFNILKIKKSCKFGEFVQKVFHDKELNKKIV